MRAWLGSLLAAFALRADPQGACEIPRSPVNQDWVLVVRRRGQGAEVP